MLAAGQDSSITNLGEQQIERNEIDLTEAQEKFDKSKAIVIEKGQHKDWTQRELALTAMYECFENIPQSIVKEN